MYDFPEPVALLDEIRGQNQVLTPSRYVGAAEDETDNVPFEERFVELRETLAEHFAQAENLNATIQKQLEKVGERG